MSFTKKERCFFNNKNQPLQNLLKRPEITFKSVASENIFKRFERDVIFAVETAIKYEGYEKRERKRNEKIKKLEHQIIPQNINYRELLNLSSESREKLVLVRPQTLAQASQIDGVRSSDIAVLSLYLNRPVSRET